MNKTRIKTEHHFVEYRDVLLKVSGCYEPGEPTVMYYRDMSGHPGTPPEFEIEKVTVNKVDITPLLDLDTFEELEQIILKRYLDEN